MGGGAAPPPAAPRPDPLPPSHPLPTPMVFKRAGTIGAIVLLVLVLESALAKDGHASLGEQEERESWDELYRTHERQTSSTSSSESLETALSPAQFPGLDLLSLSLSPAQWRPLIRPFQAAWVPLASESSLMEFEDEPEVTCRLGTLFCREEAKAGVVHGAGRAYSFRFGTRLEWTCQAPEFDFNSHPRQQVSIEANPGVHFIKKPTNAALSLLLDRMARTSLAGYSTFWVRLPLLRSASPPSKHLCDTTGATAGRAAGSNNRPALGLNLGHDTDPTQCACNPGRVALRRVEMHVRRGEVKAKKVKFPTYRVDNWGSKYINKVRRYWYLCTAGKLPTNEYNGKEGDDGVQEHECEGVPISGKEYSIFGHEHHWEALKAGKVTGGFLRM
ncbi:hypothetical protein B0H14DRAFT_2605562 [Mycena olivaceomarginata]|nr:hypothetical protein B0H14DRAFT_2605562 [Mycena olivaceomarginata]